MATKTKEKKEKKGKPGKVVPVSVNRSFERVAEATEENIPLKSIAGNTAQSRGMGVLPLLRHQGYGVFEKAVPDKQPIWTMLFSEKPEEVKEALDLIEKFQPDLVRLANKLRNSGQLQPIGVYKIEDDYDVIFGMRRTLAAVYNLAKYNDAPDNITAKVFPGSFNEIELLLMALEENDDREEESPIDKALTYQRLNKSAKMSPEDIAKHVGLSGQSIRDYLLLLDPLIEDKRMEVHTKELAIAKALELLKKRKEGKDGDSRGDKEGDRFRLYGAKQYIKAVAAGKKPGKWDQEEWDLFDKPDVIAYFAHKLNVVPGSAAEEDASKNGKTKSGKTLKIKRPRAIKLLEALGKADVKDMTDEDLKDLLEDAPNLIDDDTDVELNESLQKLFDSVNDAYEEGTHIKITEGQKAEEKEDKPKNGKAKKEEETEDE